MIPPLHTPSTPRPHPVHTPSAPRPHPVHTPSTPLTTLHHLGPPGVVALLPSDGRHPQGDRQRGHRRGVLRSAHPPLPSAHPPLPSAHPPLTLYHGDDGLRPHAVNPAALQPAALHPTALHPAALQPCTLQPCTLQPCTLQVRSVHVSFCQADGAGACSATLETGVYCAQAATLPRLQPSPGCNPPWAATLAKGGCSRPCQACVSGAATPCTEPRLPVAVLPVGLRWCRAACGGSDLLAAPRDAARHTCHRTAAVPLWRCGSCEHAHASLHPSMARARFS